MSCIGLLTLLSVGTGGLHDMSSLLMMGSTGRQAQPLLYNDISLSLFFHFDDDFLERLVYFST